VIERENTPTSLPVLTIGVPSRVLNSQSYAERVVRRLLEILLDLEQYRGTGGGAIEKGIHDRVK